MGYVPRFFIDSNQIRNGSATVVGPSARHLAQSLRVRSGEMIVLVESGSLEHGMRVETVSQDRVLGRIEWSRPATGEPSTEIHVLQAIPAKGMEVAIEALAEAGAASIRPVITSRTVSRPDAIRATHRVERWRSIAREAAQLAGRGRVPDVREPASLTDALVALPHGTRVAACVISADALALRTYSEHEHAPLAVAIGPEGGFDAAERDELRRAGAVEVHIGPRVMPCWLAGATCVSLLLMCYGELDTPVTPAPE
jgi:16S rRNA (uracil1498-N3)-methyltransferase